MIVPADMSPEEAAIRGLITADEYLDHYGEPRRPWPAVKDIGRYCVFCQHFFSRTDGHRRHMREFHVESVPSEART